MQGSPYLSIIIVSWNAKALLLECLESIETNLPSVSFEIIVVDNDSTDGSPEAVREKFPDVRCIQNTSNLGFAKANNIGIRESSGKYVCFVNSDVKVLNRCFDALCDFMDGHPSVGIVGPRILWPDLTLQDSCRHFPTLWNNLCSVLGLDELFPRSKYFSGEHMKYSPHDQECRVDSLVGCFLLVRRKALDRVGWFDERFFIYSEEVDLCKRFWQNDWEVVFVPDVMAVHYGRGSSSNTPTRFALEQKWSVLQYWQKHHSWLSLCLFAWIYSLRHVAGIVIASIQYLVTSCEKERLTDKIITDFACIRLIMGYLFIRQKDRYIQLTHSI